MEVLRKYSLFSEILLFCFLFGVISFGRAFSILNISIARLHLFITEAVLLISLPFIIVFRRSLLELPKILLTIIILYFFFGCFYLCSGISHKNAFALRDIVLCGYMLFLPLILIISSRYNRLKLFLSIILLGNVFSIIAGIFFLFNIYPLPVLKLFLINAKKFNFGFSYGLAISILVPFYSFAKKRLLKAVILFLISFNFCMFLILSVTTVWVACIALAIFHLLILKGRFIKIIIKLILPVIIISNFLFSLDYKLTEGNRRNKIIAKVGSLNIFAKRILPTKISSQSTLKNSLSDKATISKEAEQTPSSLVVSTPVVLPEMYRENLDNINWRLEIWKQSINFGLGSPLFGRGFGIYPTYLIQGKPLDLPQKVGVDSGIIPTHNHLISIFYKMGFLGLSLFLFINFYVFVYGLRYIGKCHFDFTRCFLIGSLGAFIFWHTIALFFDVIDSPPTSIFLWIIIGLIFGTIKADKECKNGLELKAEPSK